MLLLPYALGKCSPHVCFFTRIQVVGYVQIPCGDERRARQQSANAQKRAEVNQCSTHRLSLELLYVWPVAICH